MSTEVKYHPDQDIDIHGAKTPLAKMLEILTQFFGTSKIKIRIKKTGKEDAMTNEEFTEKMKLLNIKNSPKQDFEEIPMYEASFLNRMIAGKFDNCTEDSFDNIQDKRLYSKFNSLSLQAKENAYKDLKRKLNEFVLK